MTVFKIEVKDPALLQGITAAREHFNKVSREMFEGGSADASAFLIFDQDSEYVDFLVHRTAQHFSRKHGGGAASQP